MSKHLDALDSLFSELDEAGDFDGLTAWQVARLKRDADRRRAERRASKEE